MQPVFIKVYGSLCPVTPAVLEDLAQSCGQFRGDLAGSFEVKGDLLHIAFEGAYFPKDEVLQAMLTLAESGAEGKLDILDLEEWVIERHEFKDGKERLSRRGLNDVLEYSGH